MLKALDGEEYGGITLPLPILRSDTTSYSRGRKVVTLAVSMHLLSGRVYFALVCLGKAKTI